MIQVLPGHAEFNWVEQSNPAAFSCTIAVGMILSNIWQTA